ncbi:MAG TPA: aminoglycoside phosphotransferase family protein [Planctomycetota bacterium]|nr:aminoglycoside phosphotransferase family protein [Planctomycetota bacterium]
MDATATALDAAHRILNELGIELRDEPAPRAVSGHHSSVLVPCHGVDGREYLLKYFVPPEEGKFYPPEVRIEDYARREIAFYSFLDSWDSARRELPAPSTILMDPKDPPGWILLEHIRPSPGPQTEQLSADNVFDLLARLRSIPMDRLMGRRNFPLNRWDITSLRDRVVRLMYEPLIVIVGEERWANIRSFYREAMRWCETRPQICVHGDFTGDNILVDPDGRPFLVDFERIGIGAPEHDFTWFWIHSRRSREWKTALFRRFVEGMHGSDRVRSEWSMRATAVYLACRRLRFGYLTHGEIDRYRGSNLALLEAALAGGREFFPAD